MSYDQLIDMTDGSKRRIDDLYQSLMNGETLYVKSFNVENNYVENDKILNIKKKKVNEKMYRITLKDGTVLKLTENHRLYAENMEIKKVKELKVGDKLISKKNEKTFLLEIVNIEEIEYDDDVYLMEVEKNHNYFIDDILSKNCQNLTRLESRSLLSRMGEGVRCFLTGDTNQIDHKYLNPSNNGLNWILRKFKNQPNYAHVTLKGPKSRGPIADLVIKTDL